MTEEKKQAQLVVAKKIRSKSDPKKYYWVELYTSGDMRCTGTGEDGKDGCMASETGKLCRHQKIMYWWLKGTLNNIESENGGEAGLRLTDRQF